MPYTNYAELQAGIKGWLHRNNLAARIPEFIGLAEAKINRLPAVQAMEKSAPLLLKAGARSVALPAGFSSPIAAWLDGSPPERLVQRVPEGLPARSSPGQPTYWCIDGTSLAVDCLADVDRAVTLRYRGGFALSDANPTNALLTKYPDLYLYGALLQAAPYLRNAADFDLWQVLYMRTEMDVKRNESRARAGAPLRTDLAEAMGRCGFNVMNG